MNKKGYGEGVGVVLFILLIVISGVWLIGMFIVGITNNLSFDRQAGSYCKLSYEVSDIHKKVEYYDKCLAALHEMNLDGYSVWFFEKPDKYVPELYTVADSLSERMHNLLTMDKASFEYQTGMAQVEEEIAYFIGEDRDNDGNSRGCTICKFQRAYCFSQHMKIFCVA